jgi:hypothetical protein
LIRGEPRRLAFGALPLSPPSAGIGQMLAVALIGLFRISPV